MTTIAWDGTTLAADTRVVSNGQPRRCSKVFRITTPAYGDLAYGAVGDLAEAMEIADWLKNGANAATQPVLHEEGCAGLLIKLGTGESFRIIGRRPVLTPILEPFCATGSGGDFATMAMHLGKTAVQAVRLAILFDVFTAGPIESVRVRVKKKKP